jgi:hypothetical protein
MKVISEKNAYNFPIDLAANSYAYPVACIL